MPPEWKLPDPFNGLLRSKDIVRAMLSGTTQLAMLVNQEGMILDANDAMAASLSVPRDQLIGTPLRTHFLPEIFERRNPYLAQALETGEITEFEDVREHRTFVTRIAPIRDLEGRCSHAFVLSEDVTRERDTESAIRENESRYQTLVESLPQGVFFKDRSLTYVTCNGRYASDLCRRPEEIVGKNDFDLFPRAIAESYRLSDRHVLETGEDVALEGRSEAHSQHPGRYQQFIKSPVRNPSGEIVGILGIYWDITERKQAEEQQARFNEMQKRMVTLVAHELKTPLTAIAGYADLLAGSTQDERRGREILGGIRRNIHRLEQLIENFLDLERIESRSLSLSRTTFSVSELLHSLIQQHAFAWKRKGILVEAEADPSLRVYGDRDLLARALSNILSNAIKFTERGSVRMTARLIDTEILIETVDTGCGIAASALPHVFERFFHDDPEAQLDVDTSLRRGLGLTLARTIIEEHGGRIEIRSQPHKGTAVTIALPLNPVDRSRSS